MQHLGLRSRSDLVIKRADSVPDRIEFEGTAGNSKSPGDIARVAPAFGHLLVDEGDATTIDELVGGDRRHDLAPQAMGFDAGAVIAYQARRESREDARLDATDRRVVRRHQRIDKPVLGERQQNAQFRPCEIGAGLGARRHRFVVG